MGIKPCWVWCWGHMSTTTIWELKNGEEKFLWDGEILPTFCQSEGWCMILRHFAKNRVFHSEGWCRFLPTFCRNTDSEEARCTLIYRAIALLLPIELGPWLWTETLWTIRWVFHLVPGIPRYPREDPRDPGEDPGDPREDLRGTRDPREDPRKDPRILGNILGILGKILGILGIILGI